MFPYPEQYRLAAPPLITAFMVLWTLITRPLLGDASPFALYPLFMLFPLVILLHLQLIWHAKDGMDRLDQATYALIHLCLSFVVWTFAIMNSNGTAFS
ncbi:MULTISPECIES: hypothetical protein [Shewanella]|uniref:hypothetical protein n=1 Tax=Shewanella TaxID=22 RepID=UPI00048C0F48|nr:MULTISPECIES: hypothetical protein [Shewanella]QLE84275.1 hypothetical protein FLM48_03735 [Shewanella sp. Scap07]